MTAAATIVSGGPDFLLIDHIDWDSRVHLDALDARKAWPPELRPGVLLGDNGYRAFEQRLLDEFAASVDTSGECSAALQKLLGWARQLRAWHVGRGALDDLLQLPLCPPAPTDPPGGSRFILKDLMDRVPLTWRAPDWPHGLTDATYGGGPLTRLEGEAALLRYVGTRLVGSWVAYQGRGILSVAASLVSSYVLAASALSMNGEGLVTFGRLASAIRAADWLQLHLLDRESWAAWCAGWETRSDGVVELSGHVTGGARLLDRLAWVPASAATGQPRTL